jgi:hypothetical protein
VVAARGGCGGHCIDQIAAPCGRGVFGGVGERWVECEGGKGLSREVTRRSGSPSFLPGNLYPTVLLLPFPRGLELVFACVLTWEAPGGVPPVCFGWGVTRRGGGTRGSRAQADPGIQRDDGEL